MLSACGGQSAAGTSKAPGLHDATPGPDSSGGTDRAVGTGGAVGLSGTGGAGVAARDAGSDAGPGSDVVADVSPGMVENSSLSPLPGAEPTACEWDWTVRMLTYHPGAVVPRRMYFSACKTDTDSPEMLVSLSVGMNNPHPTPDSTSGALIRTRYNAKTGRLDATGDALLLDECKELSGIATSSDCSTIGVLCRRASGASGADKDVLATHPAADWMTNPYVCGDNKLNDEMWLYEWTNGDFQSEPKRYIVHKSIGSWEYGNNYLLLGDDNTYGIAIKATVGGKDGSQCHEADAFLIMDRASLTLSSTRGWSWACGTGHTIFNRPAFNTASHQYGMLCTTDYNVAGTGGLGAISMVPEDHAGKEFYYVNVDGITQKGGGSSLVPLDDGGFLGLIVGVDGALAPPGVPDLPPTSIGLVRFDAQANLVGDIRWVVSLDNTYVSYPQLTPLGDGKFALGYGEMWRSDSDTGDKGNLLRVPHAFHLLEIDQDGKPITEAQQLQGAGWGEQDQMVSLGRGRVAWAYIANPAITDAGAIVSCNADALQLSVYHAQR